MHNTRYSLLRYGLPVAVLGVAAMMLIPADDASVRAGAAVETPRTTPSYLAASPDLVAALDASLVPPSTDEDVLMREAGLPDPSTPEPVATAPMLVPAVHTEAAAPQEIEEPDDAVSSLRVGEVAVNMRSGPSTSRAVVRPLQPGESLEFGEMSGGWVSVMTAGGESGWVYSSYLVGPALNGAESEARPTARAEPVRQAETQPARQAPAATRSNQRYARVGSDVYLRAGPSQSTERLFVLPAGERVVVAETRGSWARVVLPSGASGWVRIR